LSGLGWETDFELNGLDSNIDGDSLTFNARGMCSVCGVPATASRFQPAGRRTWSPSTRSGGGRGRGSSRDP